MQLSQNRRDVITVQARQLQVTQWRLPIVLEASVLQARL